MTLTVQGLSTVRRPKIRSNFARCLELRGRNIRRFARKSPKPPPHSARGELAKSSMSLCVPSQPRCAKPSSKNLNSRSNSALLIGRLFSNASRCRCAASFLSSFFLDFSTLSPLLRRLAARISFGRINLTPIVSRPQATCKFHPNRALPCLFKIFSRAKL